MRPRFWARMAGVLLMLGAAGCSSRNDAIRSDGTVAVKLQADKKAANFTMRHSFVLELTLPEPPASGHHWVIAFHDTRYLKQLSELQPKPGEGVSIRFLAHKLGRTNLRFLLVPSTRDRTVDPVDQQDLLLTIE